MSTTHLATHLRSQHPSLYKKATQSSFLSKAGKGQLSKESLSKWLTQDRLYAQTYIRFSGLLLANIALPRSADQASRNLNERLVDCLIGALANVKRELRFFEETAVKYGLDLHVWDVDDGHGHGRVGESHGKVSLSGMSEGARGYARLFEDLGAGIEAGEKSVLECWVLLWAMEMCYLEAWRFARSFFESRPAGKVGAEPTAAAAAADADDEDNDGGALRKEFVPNWTGDEFVAFVDEIEGLLQEIWEVQGDEVGMERVESVWRDVLEVESIFWPSI